MPRTASESPRNPTALSIPVALLAVAGVTFFLLPMVALVARAPWSRAGSALSSAITVQAILLSLVVATVAVAVSIAVGVPIAWLLARGRVPGKRALRALVTVPMVLPPVVAGVGLLSAFGNRGVLGGSMESVGIHLPFTTAGAVIAAAFVAAPFLVLSVEAGFTTIDEDLEDAARTLGASESRVFRTITFPQLRPSLLAGGALSFARALGEFGATITFAGNLRGRTQTAPLAVFEMFQSDPGAAIMLSLVMLGISFVLILLLRARVERT